MCSKLVNVAPRGLRPCVLHQLGLELVETALKIALAYHRAKGKRPRPLDRPRAGLSRRQFWRHLGRRHRQQPKVIRHVGELCRHIPRMSMIWSQRLDAASRSMAPNLRTILSGSWRCMTPRPSLRRSSSGRLLERCVRFRPRLSQAACCNLRQARYSVVFDEVITAFGRLGTPFGADYSISRPTSSSRPRASLTAPSRWARCL